MVISVDTAKLPAVEISPEVEQVIANLRLQAAGRLREDPGPIAGLPPFRPQNVPTPPPPPHSPEIALRRPRTGMEPVPSPERSDFPELTARQPFRGLTISRATEEFVSSVQPSVSEPASEPRVRESQPQTLDTVVLQREELEAAELQSAELFLAAARGELLSAGAVEQLRRELAPGEIPLDFPVLQESSGSFGEFEEPGTLGEQIVAAGATPAAAVATELSDQISSPLLTEEELSLVREPPAQTAVSAHNAALVAAYVGGAFSFDFQIRDRVLEAQRFRPPVTPRPIMAIAPAAASSSYEHFA